MAGSGMADDTNFSSGQGRPDGAPRGNRNAGGRDLGGFRIRLSDNELQAARALQEAFQLRSTVAVLGFSVRTLAQMLEEGQLDALVEQLRQQGGGRPPGPRPERGSSPDGERSQRRGERPAERGGESRQARPNPFARPSRPAPAAASPTAEPSVASSEESAAEPTVEDQVPPLQPDAAELETGGVPEAIVESAPESDGAAAAVPASEAADTITG
jgi:hypothetical protein